MGLQQSVLSYLVYQSHPHDQAQIIHKKQTSDRTFRFSIERQSLQIIFQCIEPFFHNISFTIRRKARHPVNLATAFVLICKVTATLVLAGKHLVDFFDLNIAKNVFTVKTKLFTVAVVLEYTFDSESLLGWKDSSLQQ